MNTTTAAAFRPQLLPVQPPGAAPFALLVNAADDRHFVPHLRAHRVWELPETLLLLRTLRAGMHAVDVGAHVGYYSVLLSRLVGPAGRVLACEPEPENARLLRANLLLNDCGNVEARTLALAECAGTAMLALSAVNRGDHRLAAVPGRETVAVETATLDALLGDAALDFLKIDAQGAEPRILAGARRCIATQRARLGCLMEFAPGLLVANAGEGVAALAAQLGQLDARAFLVRGDGREMVLRALRPLGEGLAALAASMGTDVQIDASCDLLVVFGAEAEGLWLQRFRDGP